MPISLADLLPQTRKVQTSVGELELHGLGLGQLSHLLMSFPTLQNLFVERGVNFSISDLIRLAPEAICSILVEGTRTPAHTPEYIEASIAALSAGGMPFEDMVDCLTAIRDQTMPNGPAPLLAKLRGLLGDKFVSQFGGTEPATRSRPASNSLSPPDIAIATS